MKRLILLFLSAVLMSGCSSEAGTVFRERIVPDFEQIISGDNDVFEAYEKAIAAGEAFVQNSAGENKDAFLAAASESDRLAEENAGIVSALTDEEYAVMDSLNLARTDYDYLFASHTLSMAEMGSWGYIIEWAKNNNDMEVLAHLIASQKNKLELEKVYLVYGAMDWVVDTTRENAEYFKDMIYKYPCIMPEDCKWLTNHEEIAAEYNARLDNIEEEINTQQRYTNMLNYK